MDFIAELVADLILAIGIFLVQWCIRHKNITLAILVLILSVIDVIVLLRVLNVT